MLPALSDITWVKPHAPGENPLPWVETSQVFAVEFKASQTCVLRTQPRPWPVEKPESGGGVDANLCVIAQIGGRWYGWPTDFLRPGKHCIHAGANKIGLYSERQVTASWVPQKGELVGLFVAGLCRDGQRTVRERTNIVWTAWGVSKTFNVEAPPTTPGPPPGPQDPPPSTPPPSTPPPVDPALLARLDALAAEIDTLKIRVSLLEGAEYQASGSTGVTGPGWLGHSHPVTLPVTRVK